MSDKRIEYEVPWQDRELRFDVKLAELQLRPGELLVEEIDNVEDTKGNSGGGVMRITNIRLIWQSNSSSKVNLSVGYKTINSVTMKNTNSKLRGETKSVHLNAQDGPKKFEFIFTCINPAHTGLFIDYCHWRLQVWAYETSKLFRELKLRDKSLINDNQLTLLPLEEEHSKIEGAWNLSSDKGNLGTFITTNIRVVWYNLENSDFNVSIPYLQFKKCEVRDSKYGMALVIETSPQVFRTMSGGYVLGFRIDPSERLEEVAEQIQNLCQTYFEQPIFGVEFVKRERMSPSYEVVPNPLEVTEKKSNRCLFFCC